MRQRNALRQSAGFCRRSLLASGIALAAAGARAQGADPRPPITEFYAAVQAGMKAGGTPFRQRFDRLAPVIDRVFDLDTILRVSVGLKWASIPEASQRTLFTVFRAFTVASYVSSFDADGGEKFEVPAQIRSSGADRIVPSVLVTNKGERIKIDYLMRSGANGWRVVDVLLDGSISRVAVQRL